MFATGYKVKPMTIMDIRQCTDTIRDFFKIDPMKPFPVLPFIENVVPERVKGFSFAILDDNECEEGVFAGYYPIQKQLRCRQSVYQKAFEGDGAARGHLSHELGHIILHRNQGTVLARSCAGFDQHEKYEDSEWQANTFERELLIPFDQITPTMTINDISRRYETSTALAQVVYERYRKSLLTGCTQGNTCMYPGRYQMSQ